MRKVLQDVPVTETFRFILPFLGLPHNIMDKYCVNAYYADTANPQLDTHIFLLFEYFDDPVNEQIHGTLIKNSNFITMYHPTESLSLYCFKIPDNFIKDFKLFKNSKYSKISEDGKSVIRKWHGLTPQKDLYGILYKTLAKKQALEKTFAVVMSDGTIVSEVKLRDEDEYLELLNPEKETFDVATHILKTQ